MPRRILSLARVYQLLEPGPVVLVTTARRGRANIMTMSWHMMVDFEPPIVACVVSNRNYSFELLRSGRECAINIPTVELAQQVVGCGNTTGRRVDKFAKFSLTAVPASRIRPPLIAECYANLECRVIDTRLVNRYNIFILEVLQAWRDTARRKPRTIHHQGNGAFMVAGRTIRLKSRMP